MINIHIIVNNTSIYAITQFPSVPRKGEFIEIDGREYRVSTISWVTQTGLGTVELKYARVYVTD